MPPESIHMPVQRNVLLVCGRLVFWIYTPAPSNFVDAVSTQYTVR
jgi:hypothetical protein